MKNLLFYFFVIALLCFSYNAKAVLPDGSTAPNWTLTDINGNVHTLYDVLDQGKMVAIDFSATWCPPCWSYHNTHVLDDLYNNYGPNGTDELMVYWIEGDLSTNNACLYGPSGCVGGTMGDWVTGTPYPIIDLSSSTVRSQYNITYWPTLYAICPDRTLFEAGQASLNSWLTWLETCSFGGSATSSNVLCAGEGGGGVDLTPVGGYGGISYSWSNGETTQDLLSIEAGNYSVTMTEGNGYSIELGPFTVTGPANPLEIVTNIEQSVLCNGEATGLIDVSPTGGTPGYNYLWSNGQTSSSVNNLLPGNYLLTLTDNNNCTEVESYTLTEPSVLILETIVNEENCGFSDGEIIAQGQGGSPSYAYDIGTGPVSSGYFPNLSEGFYSLTITDDNGCTEFEDIFLANNPTPTADAGSNSAIDCATAQISLDGNGSSSGNNIAYIWSTVDGNIVSGETTTTPSVDAPGSYELLVYNTITGCQEMSSTIVVGDITAPLADAGPDGDINCSNNTVTLDGTNSESGATISYLWTTTNGNIVSGGDTTTPVVDAAGTYTLVVTDSSNGCTSSSNVAVAVNNTIPTAAANSATIDCISTQVTLNGNGSSSGTGFSYLWNTTDGNIVSGETTLMPLVDEAGTYILVVTNDSNSCTATANATVTQNANFPNADAGTASDLTCQTTNLTLDGSNSESGSNITYLWTTSNGNIVSGAATINPVVNAAGAYTLVVTNSSNGCSSSSAITIVADTTLPSADAGNANSITCSNNTVTLDGSGSSNGANFSYQWTTNNGSIISGADTDSPVVDEGGTYLLVVTNDDNGCTATDNVSVAENNNTPTANAGAGGQLTCTNNNLTLDGSNSSAGSTITYNWTTANGNIVSGADTDSPLIDESGTYTLVVTNTENGCTASATATVTQNGNLPTAEAGDDGQLTCNANQISLNGNNSSGGSNIEYQWATSNGNIVSGDDTTTPIVNEAGDYTLTVINTANGCTSTSTVSVSENLISPTAEAGSNGVLNCNNNTITLDGDDSSSGSNFTYQWTTTNGNIASGANTPTPTVDESGDYELLVTNTTNGCTSMDQVAVTETPLLELELDNQVNVLCQGEDSGSATIEAMGGNTPYSYSWPGGGDEATENNLSAGTYTATVTDGDDCTEIVNITITEPSPLTVNASVTHETASGVNDGSASVSPTGGASGYSYSWNNGATTQTINNLSPGLYTVEITDANNCTSTATVTVNSFDCFVTANVSGTNISCFNGNDGSATASLNGGNTPYTYQWSNGENTATIDNLSAGTYEVTISDNNNCPATALITIAEPAAVNVSLVSSSAVSCFGENSGSATLAASGGNNNFTYSWSTGDTGESVDDLAAGFYTITATDGSQCSATLNITVTEPAALVVALNGNDETVAGANDGTATANPTGGATPYSYLWSNGMTTATVNNLAPGTYIVDITDANGCMENGTIVINGVNCSLIYALNSNNVSCFGGQDGTISVANPSGGVGPFSYSWSTGASTSSVSDLAAGSYSVSIFDNSGCESIEEIIIAEPQQFILEANTTQPDCAGSDNGSIMLDIEGGTEPYTYSWQDGSTESNYLNASTGLYAVTATDGNGCTTITTTMVTEPAQLTLVTSSTNTSSATANDGTATVSLDGGIEPYTFIWSTGATTETISNLPPGTYEVIVTDNNGCTTSGFVVVQGVDCFLNSNIIATNISCADNQNGEASIAIIGGNEPYQYLWSNGATSATIDGLTEGTYSVTATDNLGCNIIEQVSIIAPEELNMIASTISQPNCNEATDGFIQVGTSGGTGNYNYLWNTGASGAELEGVPAGEYSVVVTDDNGCTTSESYQLIAPTAIITAIVDQSNVQCGSDGTGTAMVNANGGTGSFTYLWSDGQTGVSAIGLNAGTYTVNATDTNGCSDNISVLITASDNTPPVAIAQNLVISLNDDGVALADAAAVNNASTDNCDVANVLLDNSEFDCSNLGENIVQLIVTDGAGNTSSTTAIVTVIDNIAPVINCEEDIISGSCSDPINYALPVATDNCTTTSTELLIGLGSGAVFPIGNSIEVYRVTDESGNSSTCSFTVIVEDNQAPEVTCPSDISLSGCAQEVNYSLPTAVDLCSNVEMPTLTQGLGTGAIFPEGISTEVYEVLDAAGNVGTCSFTVTLTNNVDGDISSLQDACYNEANGSATVIGTGGEAPYAYEWSNGQTTSTATGLASQTYAVIVTDNTGCSDEVMVTISENMEIDATLVLLQNETAGNSDGAIELDTEGGSGTLTFSWTADNGYTSTDEDINGLSSGTYTCVITDSQGCTAEAGPFVVESATSIDDPELTSQISVHPNPTTGRVQIQLSDVVQEEVQLEVYDVTGQILRAARIVQVNNHHYQLDISNQANGVYLLKIQMADEVVVKRIVLSRE